LAVVARHQSENKIDARAQNPYRPSREGLVVSLWQEFKVLRSDAKRAARTLGSTGCRPRLVGSIDMAARVLKQGKLPPRLLGEVLGQLGPQPPEVRVGPGIGEDACVIDVAAGALVAASDPITLTGTDVARSAVIVNANDVAVMGVRPSWFLATVLLPPGTTDDQVRGLFSDLGRAVREVGASLVGGHTEVTAAVVQPVIVGTMLGLAPDSDFVTTAGASPGDLVLQIGGVPIEGAAVLAANAGSHLTKVSSAIMERATAARDDPGISVVEAALAAADLGATAMHDPTEGGIRGALNELAIASSSALRIDREAIIWFEPGVVLCEAAGLDPSATLASGALLATFDAEDAKAALAGLGALHCPVSIIGTVEEGTRVRDSRGRPLTMPERDEIARLTED
jgi:hydrogenase expression/formation protein HypE